MNSSKDILNKKSLIFIFKTLKEKIIKKFDFINIVEIDVLVYYHLIRNKKNKFFSLTMNEIYNMFYEPFSLRMI